MEEFLKKWLFDPVMGKVIAVVGGIIVITILVRVIQRSMMRYIKESDTRHRARKFITFMGYIAGIFLIATVFSNRLGGLTVALGVAGAGIAFALQEVIASVAGWLAISFGNFFKTGDRVQLGGIRGDVIDIGVIRTTLMECGQWVNGDLYNGRIVRIANSFVFKEPVFNYSSDFPFLWDEITVPVKYGSDYQLARKIFQQIAVEIVGDYSIHAKEAWKHMVKKFMIEDAKVEPMVTLIANDNWMEFTVRYVVDYKVRRSTQDQFFTRILEEIEKTGGKVTLASATFQVVEAPVIDVRLQK
jgi:small-conductance mechanosensitive channel